MKSVNINGTEVFIEDMIRYDEGERLTVYTCTRGFKTVGIGHNLDANKSLDILHRSLNIGDKITKEESSLLFQHDLDVVFAGIQKNLLFFDSIEPKYQLVLINMVFQMGIAGVLKFKNTLKAMQADTVFLVKSGIKNSAWYKQTPNRAQRMIDVVSGNVPKEYLPKEIKHANI